VSVYRRSIEAKPHGHHGSCQYLPIHTQTKEFDINHVDQQSYYDPLIWWDDTSPEARMNYKRAEQLLINQHFKEGT